MKEKSYEELDFTDDFLFCNILTENEGLCIELAEMITGRRIRSLVRTEDQKPIRPTRDGKGVRFDVYFEDEENIIYDIEMQTSKKGNLRKRTRYYQGMIDLNVLSRGDGYERLKESYVIFICTYDEFGKGRHQYTFENLCLEDMTIRLNDGSHKIFLCADGNLDDCSEKMKDFLNYIAGGTESGDLSDRLREEVDKSKSKEKWRLDYMTLQDKYREKYEEGKAEIILRMLDKGKTPEKVAELTDIPVEEIRRIRDEASINV